MATKGWNLKKLIKAVCDYFEVKQSDLKQKGRENSLSNAKSVICYLATQELGITSTEIAKYLVMSQPAISKAAKRGALCCDDNGIDLDVLSELSS